MSGFTGVDFGPDSCVLVRARRRGEVIELSAGHAVEPAVWPAQAGAAADLLRRLRREKGFPRVARVVAWGLAEGATPRDPATKAVLRPLIAAGFRIDAVMAPQEALALLAAGRPRPSGAAAVWMAINRHGAAIAIVRGGDLLFSRAFGWNWDAAAIGSQAQLLQRYSIVAHLAPEVRRGIEAVRSKYGVAVEAAVTCGDLPDLRSLTMPLIEELDVEVETLDSAEGLLIPPTARRDHLPDSLAAVRLACAAAAGPRRRGLHLDVVGLARAAAVVVAVASLAWMGYVWWTRPQPAPASVSRGAPRPEARKQAPRSSPTSTASPKSSASPTSNASPTPAASPTATVKPETSSGAAAAPAPALSAQRESPASVPSLPPSRPQVDEPSSLVDEASSRATAGTSPPPVRQSAPPPVGSAPSPAEVPLPDAGARRSPAPLPAERRMVAAQPAPAALPDPPPVRSQVEPRPAPPPAAARPSVEDLPPARPSRAARATPLKEPIPSIDTILVSSDRRLAMIDGAFVGIGDAVGQRTVVRIEVDAVYLREPSGLEIRVPIRVRRE